MPLLTSIVYGICFLLMLLIGTMVLLKDKRSRVNQSFFFFALSVVFWMVSLFGGYAFVPDDLPTALIVFRVAYGASILPVFFLAAFFHLFPEPLKPMKKWLAWGSAILTAVLFGICVFTPLVEESIYMEKDVQMDNFGPLYAVYLVYMLLFFLAAVFSAIRKMIKSRGIERRKIIYVSAGFFFFVLTALLTNVILPIFDIYILQSEAGAFSILFFIAVFYSVYQQRFFKLGFIALNLIRFLILISLFVASLLGIDFSIRSFLPFISPDVSLITAAVCAFFLHAFLNRYFPNLYSSEFRNFKKALAELQARLLDIKTFAALQDSLEIVFAEKLGFKSVTAFVVGGDELKDGVPLYHPDNFTKYLGKQRGALVLEELLQKAPSLEVNYLTTKLDNLEAALCLPLFSEKKLIGFLILGSKPKNAALSREEIEELEKLQKTLEVSFMNILITNTLREENDIMRQIIRQRTQTLEDNNDKLEKMIRQQDNFISLTAHEFRTPLTVAMLGLEQLSYVHKKKIPKDVLEDVGTSYNQLNKLTFLINRLLEMKRVEEDRVPVHNEKFNLMDLIEDIVKSMRLLGSSEGIEIDLEKPAVKNVPMDTDKIKLQQVMDNLLQNACKFTPKGGKITVTLKIAKKEKKAQIVVKDTGPGIPKKDLQLIFEKFQQGSRYSQGVGIGLYLCKQYVTLLKGQIWAESKPGQGASFFIELPI